MKVGKSWEYHRTKWWKECILDTNLDDGISHSFLFKWLKSKPAMTWSAKLCTRGPWKHQQSGQSKGQSIPIFYQLLIISHPHQGLSSTSQKNTHLDHITYKQVKLDLQSSKVWWNHSDSEVDYSKVIFSPTHSSLSWRFFEIREVFAKLKKYSMFNEFATNWTKQNLNKTQQVFTSFCKDFFLRYQGATTSLSDHLELNGAT